MMEKIIITESGARYVLKIDDDYQKVGIFYEGKDVGHFEFAYEFDPIARIGYWILMYMTVSHKRLGLGRQALIFHKECTQGDIIISRLGDGIDWEDGSKVEDEGIPFVLKMRKEKIIQEL